MIIEKRDLYLLNALGDMIRKKPHYLPFVKETGGIEESFYGELINLGYNKNPPKTSPDFEEFEFKGGTSTNMGWITAGFKQHKNKVVAIVGANEKTLENLEKLKEEYEVLIGDVIILPKGEGYSNKWVAVIINKK